MLVPILLFILGLILLIKGGDWFVDGASGIARRFHLPEILIGATIVSIGTTLPEVMVSATSAIEGHGQLAYGNAVGSIICNTALISAITLAIKPGKTDRKSIVLPLAFFLGSAAFFMTMAYTRREFSRSTGIVFLLTFIAYTVLSVLSMKSEKNTEDNLDGNDSVESDDEQETTEPTGKFAFLKKDSLVKEIVFLVIGAALIAVGARLLVNNGIIIAEKAGVPETVIALTFVALGTSLPELVTAITSLAKGHGNLSLGNIIGANLFNIVLVVGVSATLSPFTVPETTKLFGLPSSFVMDLPIMLTVMLILCIPALLKGKMFRVQGITLLLIYAAFITLQFIM